MRKISLFFVIIAAGLVLGSVTASAQDNQMYGPEWGADTTPLERRNNVLVFNLYKEAYQQRDYPKAMEYLSVLLDKAPAGAQNIYVYGINLLKREYSSEDDAVRRGALADSVAMLYEMRLEHFAGDPQYGTAYILKQRARDFALLYPSDRQTVRDAFEKAAEGSLSSLDADFYVAWFREITDADFKGGHMDLEQYVSYYDRITALLRQVPGSDDALRKADELFIGSGASDPASIERIIRGRIAEAERAESEEDLYAELFASLSLMQRLDYRGELYEQTARRLMEMEPTTQVSVLLALYYRDSGDQARAAEMWSSAAGSADTPSKRAAYLTMAASAYLDLKRYDEAIGAAEKSLAADPAKGYSNYMIIANAYSSSAVTGDLFDRKTVYWLAADMLLRAMDATEDPEERSRAGQLLEAYGKNFPGGKELFSKGLKEGEPYEVNYGRIKGSTTVRSSGGE